MSRDLPMVAVLMTLYRKDRLDFFDEAVASLENQTYPRERIHVYLAVDGEIPPAHEEALKRHAHRFYRIHRRPTNDGLAIALNELLDQVGDEAYVLRMDGDDVAVPTRFQEQVDFLETHREIDLLGGNAWDIDEEGRKLRPREYPELHRDIARLLPRINSVLHPTYCIRGSSLRRDRLRYPNAFLTEDWAFLFVAVERGWKLHNLQTTVLHWRTSGDFFLRRSGFKRGWQEFKAVESGTWRVFGCSPQLLWPWVRFGFRLLPKFILKRAYASKLRSSVTSK